jgi:hypothetical protein
MAGTSSQRVTADRQLEVVERVTGHQLREALLEVGTHLGWDHQTVVSISETVMGRAWQRCRADDVIRVARVLLEVASALRSAGPVHAVTDADIVAILDVTGGASHRRA